MPKLPFYQSFYLSRWVYYAGFAAASFFVLSFFIPFFSIIGIVLIVFTGIVVLADALLLYGNTKGVFALRETPDRMSNGDENKILITLSNTYAFAVRCIVIDELPFQFQERDWKRFVAISRNAEYRLEYVVIPVTRGQYEFGNINIYASSPLRMVQRRFRSGLPAMVNVYPSFIQMRRYQLAAIGNQLQETGTKKVRKLGHSIEFDLIKDYVYGDDHRSVNWKATARKGGLMMNAFTDERSQPVYCVINKGRVMKMPFEGMTLLDYSINAALALLNVALRKGDKAGLITYADTVETFLPADKKATQVNTLLQTLYNEQTRFSEPDNEVLFATIRNRIAQRSLLILFTNFESIESLERQLSFFKLMARYHLVIVVFFENTELKSVLEGEAKTTEAIYIKTIAQKYQHEKKAMVKALRMHGIIAVLTAPQQLTVTTLNKYLELKKRQTI